MRTGGGQLIDEEEKHTTSCGLVATPALREREPTRSRAAAACCIRLVGKAQVDGMFNHRKKRRGKKKKKKKKKEEKACPGPVYQ